MRPKSLALPPKPSAHDHAGHRRHVSRLEATHLVSVDRTDRCFSDAQATDCQLREKIVRVAIARPKSVEVQLFAPTTSDAPVAALPVRNLYTHATSAGP